MLMQACDDLKPTVLNTTPWMVEGFCEMLHAGIRSEGLQGLHFLTYGGAALKPHCGVVLEKFSIRAQCTYGKYSLVVVGSVI
jgi:hypothetical protein